MEEIVSQIERDLEDLDGIIKTPGNPPTQTEPAPKGRILSLHSRLRKSKEISSNLQALEELGTMHRKVAESKLEFRLSGKWIR